MGANIRVEWSQGTLQLFQMLPDAAGGSGDVGLQRLCDSTRLETLDLQMERISGYNGHKKSTLRTCICFKMQVLDERPAADTSQTHQTHPVDPSIHIFPRVPGRENWQRGSDIPADERAKNASGVVIVLRVLDERPAIDPSNAAPTR
jgi:hypothetical protein